MNVLVTGATGFIGSHLVDLLLKKGHSVRCLLRATSDDRWIKGLPVEKVTGDLFDTRALRTAVEGVDYIYHSAGLTKAKTPDEYFRANAGGTRNLLEAVLGYNSRLKRFIHISSQTAAGPSPTKFPINEDHPAAPITSYGKSKLAAEQECHKLRLSIPWTIVRPPAVFGPRDKDVFEFFSTMNKGLQPMVGLSEKYVSLIHVRDLVRGFVMAGESEKSVGQIYFIASKDVYGWKEVGTVTRKVLGKGALRLRIPEFGVYIIAAVAEGLASFSKKPALINFEKARDMVQDYWTCDSSKALRDFGYEQDLSLEEGIRDAVEWYKKEGWIR